MGDFRAKDADRERFVELIEAAYADRQLSDADRELRVGRAKTAETLEELGALTRDLRLPQGYVPPAPPTRTAPRPRRVAGVMVGLGVFVALLGAAVTGVVALAMFAVSGESDSTTSQGVEAPVESSTVVGGADEVAPFEMTVGQVRRALRAYEAQFGSLDAFEVSFFPDRVQAQVPVRGARPRMERWTWDGTWRQDTTATAVTGPFQRVDAGSIDVRRLFANIDVATRSLDVEKARFTHAILMRWNDEPTELNIYVGNEFNESGYLSTTPAGEVRRRHPYTP